MKYRFVLTSQWRLDCSASRVWTLLEDVGTWPAWWPEVSEVSLLDQGAQDGTGRSAGLVWRTPLPYRLRLQITRTRALPPLELEGTACGDLDGCGLWLLEPQPDDGVIVTCRWDVCLSRAWMRRLTPLLGPLFAWSHFRVMRSGARGMARYLDSALTDYRDIQPRLPDFGAAEHPRHA